MIPVLGTSITVLEPKNNGELFVTGATVEFHMPSEAIICCSDSTFCIKLDLELNFYKINVDD